MKQLIKNNLDGKLSFEEVPSPTPQPGHVVVRTLYSSVSLGTEISSIDIAKKNLFQKSLDRRRNSFL